jgi:protein-tyrosine kinase
MSIIERAASRLGKGRNKGDDGGTRPPTSPEPGTAANPFGSEEGGVDPREAAGSAAGGVVGARQESRADESAAEATAAESSPSIRKPDTVASPGGERGAEASAQQAAATVDNPVAGGIAEPTVAPRGEEVVAAQPTSGADVAGKGVLSGDDSQWNFGDIGGTDEHVIEITKLNPGLLLSPEGGRTRTAEEFRVIKRPLLVNAFDRRDEGHKHSNLIMVTSAVQSEGKTFVSLNLAISIAMEMDSTVLLVDADVAKPGLSKVLQIPGRPGLIEQLTSDHDNLADLLVRTDIPKLTVLPAGQQHKRSTELLASLRMRELLDELASRYSDRIVLFDSPPLLESTEAFVLASQMGQVVMVVESESTSQMVVKEALSQFDNLDNVSLILNKCKESLFTTLLSGKYSGYGYGYGYGYGSESDRG